jgi:hypothetical protein
MAPGFMPAKTPVSGRTTLRRSSSLPTQVKTISAFLAASAGVPAAEPPYSLTQAPAFSRVRL